jgi:hypothetical protein
MKTVGSNDAVEAFPSAGAKQDFNTARHLVERCNLFVEARFDPVAHGLIYEMGQVAALDAQEPVPERAAQRIAPEAAALSSIRANEYRAVVYVSLGPQRRKQSHVVGNVIAHAPEVDDVTAFAKFWSALDDDGLETAFE